MTNPYEKHLLPRLIAATCGNRVFDPLRDRVCAGLYGDVVEIGFGSGTNIGHYPARVHQMVAVEPSPAAWQLSEAARSGSRTTIVRGSLDGQRMDEGDASFDAALSSFTLCTIKDPLAALAEVHRVLKPGGTLHFLEHGLAPDPKVRRWQHRMEPFQKALAGGCHLTRSTVSMLEQSGFRVLDLEQFYQPGAPRFEAALSLGTAVRD